MKSIIFSAAYVALILATIAIPAVAIFSDVAADTEQALQTASDILLIIFSAASAAILAATVLFRQKDGRRYLEALNGVNTDKSIDYFKKSIKYQFVPSVYFPAVAYYVSLSYKAGRHLDAFEFMNKHPKYYKYRALTYFYSLKALYEEDLFKAKELIFELEKGGKKYIKQITLIEKLQNAAETGDVSEFMFLNSVYPIVNEILDKIIAKHNPSNQIAIEVKEHIEEV